MTLEQIDQERKAFLEWLQRTYPSEGSGPSNIVNGLEKAWLASAERNRMPDTVEHTFQHYRTEGGIACKLCEQIEARLQRIRELPARWHEREKARHISDPLRIHVEWCADELEKELKG